MLKKQSNPVEFNS